MSTTPHTMAGMVAARVHELPLVATTIYRAELHAARRPTGRRARTVLALRLAATAGTLAAAGVAGTHGHPWAALPLGLAALVVMAGPLAITALPGWIAWTNETGRAVTITDPHAHPIGHWNLTPDPGGSQLEAHLVALLDTRPAAASGRPDLLTAEQHTAPDWESRHHAD